MKKILAMNVFKMISTRGELGPKIVHAKLQSRRKNKRIKTKIFFKQNSDKTDVKVEDKRKKNHFSPEFLTRHESQLTK